MRSTTRRSLRLPHYDYSKTGAYFVTICTQSRQPLFGSVVHDAMCLNDPGKMVQHVWNDIPAHYPAAKIDAFIVMPNHVHGILVIRPCSACEGRPQGAAPTALYGQRTIEATLPVREFPGTDAPFPARPLSLPDLVQRFKTITTRHYIQGVAESGWLRFQSRLWQRGYYERIVRNDRELEDIRRYVHENPVRWAVDRENFFTCRGGPLWPPEDD